MTTSTSSDGQTTPVAAAGSGYGDGGPRATHDALVRPVLKVFEGGGLTADEAAWALIADAAEQGLMLPGLTASGASKLARVMIAGDQASRRPPRPLPQSRQTA